MDVRARFPAMPQLKPIRSATLLAGLVHAALAPTSQGQAPVAKDASAAVEAFAIGREEPLISYRRNDGPPAAVNSALAPVGEQNSLRPQAVAPAGVQSPFGSPPVFDPRLRPATVEEKAAAPLSKAPLAADLPVDLDIDSPSASEAPPFDAASLVPPADGADRRLAPPSPRMRRYDPDASPSRAASFLPQAFGRFKSLSSAGAGLAVVVALFLICMSLIRRSGPKSNGTLPSEAFSVLGRAPLTAQSYAQLVRLGNKLVLVAVGAEGAHPLAEVTDPLEVDRIAGLCSKAAPHGPSAEFQQVLAQLSREPAKGFLGREASTARRRG